KPYFKYLRSYFYTAYYFIKSKKRPQSDKLRTRAQKGHFIGFNNIHNRIIFIWNLYISEIVRTSAVTFLKEDPVNYKDLIRSSDSNVIKYYIIFSDQTVNKTNKVVDSGY
ncbi:hypothetical protein GE21DRAFT_1221222, partial [Neurospora crassa]